MKIPSGKLLFAVLLCIYSLSPGAGPASENIVRIPTVTLLVKTFTQFEIDIITAFKQKDQEALSRLIDQYFEMQAPAKSGDPVPRSAWLETSQAEGTLYQSDITNMSVHDFGQTAIVSFEWKPFGAGKTRISPVLFIVDVWKKDADNWKLAIRYSATAQKSGARFPGFSPSDNTIEKKY